MVLLSVFNVAKGGQGRHWTGKCFRLVVVNLTVAEDGEVIVIRIGVVTALVRVHLHRNAGFNFWGVPIPAVPHEATASTQVGRPEVAEDKHHPVRTAVIVTEEHVCSHLPAHRYIDGPKVPD